jgi:hypothetical protein
MHRHRQHIICDILQRWRRRSLVRDQVLFDFTRKALKLAG